MKRRIPAILILALFALPLAAQRGDQRAAGEQQLVRVPMDRVVAIVGTTPILWTDVVQIVDQRRAAGMPLPDSTAQIAMARQIVSDLVDEEILVQRAGADTSITVSDADLTETVEAQIKQLRSRIPSDQEFINALKGSGFGNVEEYRRWLTDQSRRRALQQRYVDKLKRDGKMITVAVTDADIKEAFERQKETFPKRPPSVTFRQIVIATTASDKARAAAHAKADSLRAQIRAGGNFEQIAKRESMDSVSREVGGDLGWNRRENLVPEFASVLFQLQPGQLGVVETAYGYHIIRVERVRSGEVRARQILIKPRYDSADVTRAKSLADSVLRLWKSGTVPYDTLLKKFHDKDEVEGSLEPFPRDSLPASYGKAFETKGRGDYVDPFPIQDPQRGVPKFVVAQLIDVTAAGDYTLADLRDRIRSQLQDERSFRRLIDELKKETYVWVNLEGGGGGKPPSKER
jgi:peptidyl-prolyl cis-trans isomerase SurA